MNTWRALAVGTLLAGCAGRSLTKEGPVEGTGGASEMATGGSGGAAGLHRGGSTSAGGSAGRSDGTGGRTGGGAIGGTSGGAGEAGEPAWGGASARGGTNGSGAQGGMSVDVGESGSAGQGSEAGSDGESHCPASPVIPEDDGCDYPESLGGGGVADECGVTEGAWYPLGASDLSTWPARVASGTSGGLGDGIGNGLTMDGDGNPIVGIDCEAHVWNGDSWEVRPAPEVPNSLGASGCNFGMNDQGELFVAYVADSDHELYLARWETGGWEPLGVQPIAVTGDRYPGLVFDADGNPTVMWEEENDNLESYYFSAKRFDPDAGEWRSWQFGSSNSIEIWGHGRFTLGDGAPVLTVWNAYYGDFAALEFDGERWVDIESGVLAKAMSGSQPMAECGVVRDSLGRLIIYKTTPDALRLFRRLGDEWEEVSPTDELLETLPPAVRLRSWYDYEVENEYEIHVARFEGCGWRGLSASDRGGGISNSDDHSDGEMFVAAGGRVCVSWREYSSGTYRNALRCHDLPDD